MDNIVPVCYCSRMPKPHPWLPTVVRNDRQDSWCPIEPVTRADVEATSVLRIESIQMPQPRPVDYAAVHINRQRLRVTDTQGVTTYETNLESDPGRIETSVRCAEGECVECGICLAGKRFFGRVSNPGWCGTCAPYGLAAWFWFYSPVGRIISRWKGLA